MHRVPEEVIRVSEGKRTGLPGYFRGVVVLLVLIVVCTSLVEGARYNSPCYNSKSDKDKATYDNEIRNARGDISKGRFATAEDRLNIAKSICNDWIVNDLISQLHLEKAKIAQKANDNATANSEIKAAEVSNNDADQAVKDANLEPGSATYFDAMIGIKTTELGIAIEKGAPSWEIGQLQSEIKGYQKNKEAAEAPGFTGEIALLGIFLAVSYMALRRK